MLLQKPITKRDKREMLRKHRGRILLLLGLLMIAISLFYTAYLEKPDPILSPLSKNQTTEYVKVLELLSQKQIKYKSVDTQEDLNYKLVLSKNEEVILDSKKSISAQLSSLQLILSQLKIEGKTFRRLDFRFEKPIISM